MDAPLEHRLVVIESQLAQLEHLVDRLNEVIQSQDLELRQFKKAQQHLVSKLESFTQDAIPPHNQPPPHYQ